MILLKSAFGSVRPYTRDIAGCRVQDDSCSCPKWLYEYRKGCIRRRYALNTPSFAAAQRIAPQKLRGFDPEQLKATFAPIDETVPANIALGERDIYAARLRAFITLLLNGGCDLIDGVQFNQAQLEDVPIDGHLGSRVQV
jgi:hypothetical protein